VAKPAPPPKRTERPKKPLSPQEILAKRYGTSDMVEVATAAMRKQAYDDAIAALEATPKDHAKSALVPLLLLDASLGAGDLRKARSAASDYKGRDAYFDLLRGELSRRRGDFGEALRYYGEAVLKPSAIRDPRQVRGEALLYTARVRTELHKASPSNDTRLQALNAWMAVKRQYSSEPSHAYFKEANATMATIR